MTLSAAEHFEWLALRRVSRGGMTRDQGGCFADFGQSLGEFLAEVVTELLEHHLLDIGEASPRDGLARVRHTDPGQARYTELCRKQRRATPRNSG